MSELALPLVHKALRRAGKLHRKQERDGAAALPYLSHPVDVLNILRYEGKVTDDEVLAAGLLHDVIEETDETIEDVCKRFGERVAGIVGEVTRDEPDRTGLSQEQVWQLRTDMLLAEIDKMSPEAKSIKLADRISNLQGAKATKAVADYQRYVRQSELILNRIPMETNDALWRKLQSIVQEALESAPASPKKPRSKEAK
jgi:(p)ppGpp synthase/HD superfamily hydrolase